MATSIAPGRTRNSSAFVEALAMRVASFDKQAIVETKIFVNIASLPPTQKLRASRMPVSPLFSAPQPGRDQRVVGPWLAQAGRC